MHFGNILADAGSLGIPGPTSLLFCASFRKPAAVITYQGYYWCNSLNMSASVLIILTNPKRLVLSISYRISPVVMWKYSQTHLWNGTMTGFLLNNTNCVDEGSVDSVFFLINSPTIVHNFHRLLAFPVVTIFYWRSWLKCTPSRQWFMLSIVALFGSFVCW